MIQDVRQDKTRQDKTRDEYCLVSHLVSSRLISFQPMHSILSLPCSFASLIQKQIKTWYNL